MNPDAKVPNQGPLADPGAVRLAIVGESPAESEVSWSTCSSGHGFSLRHWSNRQLVTRDRCDRCGSTSFVSTPKPFCLDHDTLVLRADLRWVRLGDVEIGDTLLTCTEQPIDARGISGFGMRLWCTARVTNKETSMRDCMLLSSDDGSLVGTPDHRVLVNNGDGTQWREIGSLWANPPPRKASHLYRVCSTWSELTSYDAGWLAGFFDGEGHVLGSHGGKSAKHKANVGFSQNVGPLLDKAMSLLMGLGFSLRATEKSVRKGVTCMRCMLAGGFDERLRFLGSIRPSRLINDFIGIVNRGTCSVSSARKSRLYARHQLGRRRVVDITTTSGTFIANGFLVHNCGESGRLLDAILSDSGLPRERVWVGNCSRTPLSEGEKDLEHCRGGLAMLAVELEEYKPTLVLCLGGLSLSAFGPPRFEPSPTKWRGSRFTGTLEGVEYECMAAMHPAAILREPSQLALLRFDIARAVAEAAHPSPPPARTIGQPTYVDSALGALESIRKRQQPVGYDIEGDHKCVTVVSFATSSLDAISIPLRAMDYSRLWSTSDEECIMRAVGDVLEDAAVPKVCHNTAFETFVHRWLYGHRLRSPEDSMIAFNVMWPELDKNLSVAASILTMTPYWGETSDWRNQADRDTYNAIDSCVCLEAWQRLMAEFTPAQRAYYTTQRDLLEPCGEMSFEGMSFDASARDALVDRIQDEVFDAQGKLDQLAGIPQPPYGEVAEAVAFKVKRDKCQTWSDLLTYAKPSYRENL